MMALQITNWVLLQNISSCTWRFTKVSLFWPLVGLLRSQLQVLSLLWNWCCSLNTLFFPLLLWTGWLGPASATLFCFPLACVVFSGWTSWLALSSAVLIFLPLLTRKAFFLTPFSGFLGQDFLLCPVLWQTEHFVLIPYLLIFFPLGASPSSLLLSFFSRHS